MSKVNQSHFMEHYIFTPTTECNQDCLFCLVKRDARAQCSYKDTVTLLRKLHKQGIIKLSIDGGEPTLLSYFNKLIRQSIALGFKTIAIKTNGLGFSNYKFAQNILEGNETIIYIYVFLHGPNKISHDKLTQTRGSFDTAIKAAKNIIELQGNIIANIVINNLNFLYLKEYIDLLKKINIRETLFLFILPKGNALKNNFLIPNIKNIIPFIKEAIDYANSKNIHVGLTFFPFCLLGDYYIDFAVETHIPTSISNFDKSSGEIYKSNKCRDCKYFSKCPGIRREYFKLNGFHFKPIK